MVKFLWIFPAETLCRFSLKVTPRMIHSCLYIAKGPLYIADLKVYTFTEHGRVRVFSRYVIPRLNITTLLVKQISYVDAL